MKKFFSNISLILFVFCFISGCEVYKNPINVTFKDGTLYGSENHTLIVVYAEDKRLHEYYTDIFVKSNQNNAKFVIGKEMQTKFEVCLCEKNKWYSLSEIWFEKINLITFAKAQTTTYVLSSEMNFDLTLKAVGGDYSFNAQEGQAKLINCFDVSKEFTISFNKT